MGMVGVCVSVCGWVWVCMSVCVCDGELMVGLCWKFPLLKDKNFLKFPPGG